MKWQALTGVTLRGRRFEPGEAVTVRPPKWMVDAGHVLAQPDDDGEVGS